MTRLLSAWRFAIFLTIGIVGLFIASLPAVSGSVSLGTVALVVAVPAIAWWAARNAQPTGSLGQVLDETDNPPPLAPVANTPRKLR